MEMLSSLTMGLSTADSGSCWGMAKRGHGSRLSPSHCKARLVAIRSKASNMPSNSWNVWETPSSSQASDPTNDAANKNVTDEEKVLVNNLTEHRQVVFMYTHQSPPPPASYIHVYTPTTTTTTTTATTTTTTITCRSVSWYAGAFRNSYVSAQGDWLSSVSADPCISSKVSLLVASVGLHAKNISA